MSQLNQNEIPKRNLKFGEPATLRDSKGRPYYLIRLPWYRKYPRAFRLLGGAIGFFAVSGPFLYKVFRNNDDVTYEMTLWPSEIKRGKTNRQRYLEKYHPEKYQEEVEAAKAAKRTLLGLPLPEEPAIQQSVKN